MLSLYFKSHCACQILEDQISHCYNTTPEGVTSSSSSGHKHPVTATAPLEQLLARSMRPTRENPQKAGPRIVRTEIWCSEALLWPISFCKCKSRACLYCFQQLHHTGDGSSSSHTSTWLWLPQPSLPAAQLPRLRLLFLPPQCQAVWPCPPGGMSQQQQEHFTWLTISLGISMATTADAVSLMAPKELLHSLATVAINFLVISKGARG